MKGVSPFPSRTFIHNTESSGGHCEHSNVSIAVFKIALYENSTHVQRPQQAPRSTVARGTDECLLKPYKPLPSNLIQLSTDLIRARQPGVSGCSVLSVDGKPEKSQQSRSFRTNFRVPFSVSCVLSKCAHNVMHLCILAGKCDRGLFPSLLYSIPRSFRLSPGQADRYLKAELYSQHRYSNGRRYRREVMEINENSELKPDSQGAPEEPNASRQEYHRSGTECVTQTLYEGPLQCVCVA